MKIRNTILSLLLFGGGLVAGFAPTASAEIVNKLPKHTTVTPAQGSALADKNNPTAADIKAWFQTNALDGWYQKASNGGTPSSGFNAPTLSNNGSTLTMPAISPIGGGIAGLQITLSPAANYDHLSFSFTLTAPVSPATINSVLWYAKKDGTIVEVTRDVGVYNNQQTKDITLGFSAEQLAAFNADNNGKIYTTLSYTGGTDGTITYNDMKFNVGTAAAVPEASTASLALIGLSLFILRRRRRVES